MPDVHSLVNEFVVKLNKRYSWKNTWEIWLGAIFLFHLVYCLIRACFGDFRQIEGSKTTAKLTAELLRSFISQQRLPHRNQAGALIDAVKSVGEKLIAAKPVGMLTLLARFVKLSLGFLILLQLSLPVCYLGAFSVIS